MSLKYRDVVLVAIGVALVGIARPVRGDVASTQPAGSRDLTALSIDDLMNLQVTSVAKQPQRIADAPAAVTVVGQNDIQDSGLNSIPELLRLVPGMDVQQINANRWGITSRGFNGLFADDLLVLMDGRSVYTPVFGGVRWNAVDYSLPDLDRIEVIRGPGSTLWGSNAVNGVVNIQTKTAEQTQGWLLDSRGSTDQSEETARYGGKIDADTYYRVYEKSSYTDSDITAANDPAHDYASGYQGGFRIDRNAGAQDTLTLRGDGYYQQLADTAVVLTDEVHTDHESGGNLEGRWTHAESEKDSTSLQVYYDRQNAEDLPAPYQQDTYDVDFQNRFGWGKAQEVTWGLGARDTEIRFSESFPEEFSQEHWSDYIYSGFVQDQVTVIPDRVQLYLGTKLEYTKLVELQVQPSARLMFTPDEKNSVWAAVSRSVREPSIYQEEDLNLGGFMSDHAPLSAEQAISYEVGYKVEPAATIAADATIFYNSYRDLINYTPTFFMAFPTGVLYDNSLKGNTYGAELSAHWQATPTWRLQGSYSVLTTIIRGQGLEGAGVTPVTQDSVEGSVPRNQFQIHSYFDVTPKVKFNVSAYYEDALPTLASPPVQEQKVPAYAPLDLGLACAARENMTISAGVQNLLQHRHAEYGNFNSNIEPSEVQRAYYAQCSITF